MKMFSYICALAAVLCASISQIFLKKMADVHQKDTLVKKYLNLGVIFGYSLLLVSTLLNTKAFQVLPLKISPAIDSLGIVLVIIFSKFFLYEKIGKNKVFGIIFILFGVILFSIC